MSSGHAPGNASPLEGRTILVTGGSGFLGRNLVPLLEAAGGRLVVPSHADYDLTEQQAVRRLFADVRPEIVFHLAGVVGGILANDRRPADFSYPNVLMGSLGLHEAWKAGVRKYITLIGGCSYPGDAPSPISEKQLWSGYPQTQSAPYSLAKRMSVVLSQAYRKQHDFDAIVLVPGNVYGPHDNFDLEAAHVIPALIRKFWEARERGETEVTAWGSGRPARDFVYAQDACEAIVLAAERYSGPDIINLSSGSLITIRELVETIVDITGYRGRVVWDESKPDGQKVKGFDVDRMRRVLGYECRTSLREGLGRTFTWFEENHASARL